MVKNLIFLFLCIFAGTAQAQWSNDPSVNTRVTNGGLLPQIISDGSGGAYIVYQDSPALQRQLWVQWLDRYGFVRFPQNGIRVSAVDRNQTPYYFLASDSTGGVIVVFQDFQEIEGETVGAVYAQRIDSTGAKLWGEAGLEVSPPADNKGPVSACSDGSHGVFIFWGEDADSSGVPELWGQRVSASGELIWPDNGIVITDEFTSFNVAIPNPAVSDGNEGAIVAYSNSNLRKIQRIDKQGNKLWNNGTEIILIDGKMFPNGSAGGVLAGRHIDLVNNVSYRALKINHIGDLDWGMSGIVVKDFVESTLIPIPGVAFNDNKETVFVWQEGVDEFANIYYNKIDEEGNLIFAEKINVSTIQSKKVAPKLVSGDNSKDVVFWYDNRDDINFNIYTQKLNLLGEQEWSENDVAMSARTTNERNFQVVSDLAGGSIICWYEIGLGSGFGIFAQQVSRNSNLGEVLVTSVSESEKRVVPDQFILHQSYPNPFNAEMVLKYELPKSSFVTLTIFDITGKEVVRLINQEQGAGNYQVRWQGHNQKGGEVASGIYFYQLRAATFVQVKKALFIK